MNVCVKNKTFNIFKYSMSPDQCSLFLSREVTCLLVKEYIHEGLHRLIPFVEAQQILNLPDVQSKTLRTCFCHHVLQTSSVSKEEELFYCTNKHGYAPLNKAIVKQQSTSTAYGLRELVCCCRPLGRLVIFRTDSYPPQCCRRKSSIKLSISLALRKCSQKKILFYCHFH